MRADGELVTIGITDFDVTEDEQTFGMVCSLVSEDKIYNYTRLISRHSLQNFKLSSFYSDDMMYSFQTVVKENKI